MGLARSNVMNKKVHSLRQPNNEEKRHGQFRQAARWADCPALDFLLLFTTLKLKIGYAESAFQRS